MSRRRVGYRLEAWPTRARILRTQSFTTTPYLRKTFDDSGVESPAHYQSLRPQPFSSTPYERKRFQLHEKPELNDSLLGEYSGASALSTGEQSGDLQFEWDHFRTTPQTIEYSDEIGLADDIEGNIVLIDSNKTPTNITEDIEILREIGLFIDYPNPVLGSGSYGVVYRGYFGRDSDSEDADFETVEHSRCFAVKVMDFNKVKWGKTRENFETEKFILTEVNHKNVVTIRMIINIGEQQSLKFVDYPDVGYTLQDRAYLFMDYADEGTLDSWLAKNFNRIDPSTMIKLIRDLFFGMQYLHQNYILHGDVHAGNALLYTEDNELVAKWADFGVSKTSCDRQYRLRGPQITVEYFRENCFQDIMKMFDIFERILENRITESETPEETYQLNECQEMVNIRRFGSIEELYEQFSHVFGDEIHFDEKHFA